MRSLPFNEKTPQMPQKRKTSAFRRQSSSVGAVFGRVEFFAFRQNRARVFLALCLSVFRVRHAASALFFLVSVSTVMKLSQF
jgi:hypothetical protein